VVAWLHQRHREVAYERSEAMKRTRRNHGATFKAQVAVAAIKGDKTLTELAEQFSVHPTQITEWKQQLLARAAEVFGGTKPTADTPDLKTLHAKIGQLALEHDC
jgi:transposase